MQLPVIRPSLSGSHVQNIAVAGQTLPDCGFCKRFIILNDTVPDPQDAILVALMHSWNGFNLLLAPEDLHE